MSVLHGKNVLVIGDETSQVHDIETALEREGAVIHATTCEQVTIEVLENDSIDVIFLNHLHDNKHCKRWLSTLQKTRDVKVLPVFTLVDDNPASIEEALAFGAADYFTTKETVKSILHKVKIVLGDSVNSAENSVIDIGQMEVTTKTSGIRVLIVEDDPLLANLLTAQFERASFPYHVNHDGEDALADIEEFKPDIVILDLMLPGRSGFDVLTDIRAHETYKDLPVFIFSNRDSADDKKRADDLKVTGFYVKAMTDLSDLVKKIESAAKPVD